MKPVNYEVSVYIFYDPVALWNFMNALTDLLLELGRQRVPVLWTVFLLVTPIALTDKKLVTVHLFKDINWYFNRKLFGALFSNILEVMNIGDDLKTSTSIWWQPKGNPMS